MKKTILILAIFFAILQSQAQIQMATEVSVFNALINAKQEPTKYYCAINDFALARYLSSPELEKEPTALIEKLILVKNNDSLRNQFYEQINYYFSSNQTLIKDAFNCKVISKKKYMPLCSDAILNEFINIIQARSNDYERKRNEKYNATGEIDTSITEIASYIGGEAALIKHFLYQINYPQFEKESDIQGRVLLSFIVEKDGNISNIQIIKGVSEGINDEAKRVLKLCGKFTAATHNGVFVRQLYKYPITFRLQ